MSKFKNDPTIRQLVAAYEDQYEQGQAVFFEEKVYLKIIEFYEKDYQSEKALEAAENAIAYHAYSVECYCKKAELLIHLGREEEALAVLDQAVCYAPTEPEISLLRAKACIQRRKVDDGLAILEEMKEEADSELLSDIYVVEAMAHEQAEAHEQMYHALALAVAQDPSNAEALMRLGQCVELCRKYEESLALHDDLLEKDAYCAVAWYNLGQAHASLGNYPEAIQAFEYAYLIDENYEEACRECANLCLEFGKYDKALKLFEALLEQPDPESDICVSIGQCLFHQGKHQSAIAFYRHAIELDPLNDEAYFYLGECYLSIEEWYAAAMALDKAIEIEDKREEYYGALAHAYYGMDDLDKAQECFWLAIESSPEDHQYWLKLAIFLLDTERPDEAVEVLEQAEDTAVGAELLYARVACLLAMGRRQESFSCLIEALQDDFDAHRLLFEILPELEQDAAMLALIATYQQD
jgi:tetratricopeptide (TPR) repeat protein